MSDIYAHPTITSSPDLIQALQDRFGLRAIVQGHRVRLIQIPPDWRGRTARRGERRGNALFVVGPDTDARRDEHPGRPQ